MKLTLDNGLEVVLEENHAAPVVAFQAWVGVGSADESREQRGMAHMFEHMLFKGTKRRGVGRIAQEVEAAGGDINAWTSFDETVYHLVLASRFFDTGLDILADALTSSTFDPAELERERKVVLEEIKQGEDSPDRVVSQLLFSASYRGHPYGRPVIGEAATVERFTRDDVVRFFESRYVAENVTLVVVGDFASRVARGKIAAAFAAMRRAAPPPARAPEPEQREMRVVAEARDVKEGHLLYSFHTPSIRHEDVPALDLLAVVLGQGDSSRLNIEVVRNRQLVTSAYAYVLSPRDAGLFVVGAAMPPGRVDEVARALLDEVTRLGREEIRPAELAKARNVLESGIVFDKETVQGYARKLGYFARIAGDVDFEDRYFERLRRLTAADLRAVAAKYFTLANATAASLVPEAVARKRSDRAAKVAARLRAVGAAAEARADRRFARAAAAPTAGDDVSRHLLGSGVKVLLMRDGTVPAVAVRAVWIGGLRAEEPRSNGISNMLAALITRGTKTRSAEEIMHEVEGMAGSLDGSAGRNSLGLRAEFLSRHWERGLEILADCIRNPGFADDEIERERRIVLDDLRAQEDSLGQVAFRLFHNEIWKKHPYRMDPLGTPASVAAMTRRRLIDHYRRHYPLAGLTIAVVGDFDEASLLAKLEALFGDAPSGEAEPVRPPSEPSRAEPAEVFQFLARQQAHVILGFPGVTLRSPDRFALDVLAQVLSGQGGRLFSEMREKRALAYRVSAFSVEGLDPGYFGVYIACSPENLDQAVRGIRDELAKVVAEGIAPEELERAQRYLVGTHAISLQRKSAIAAALAFHEAYGQGWREYRRYDDGVGKVTAADVRRVATQILDPKRAVLAVVKPSEETPAAAKAVAAGAKRGLPGGVAGTPTAGRESGNASGSGTVPTPAPTAETGLPPR